MNLGFFFGVDDHWFVIYFFNVQVYHLAFYIKMPLGGLGQVAMYIF